MPRPRRQRPPPNSHRPPAGVRPPPLPPPPDCLANPLRLIPRRNHHRTSHQPPTPFALLHPILSHKLGQRRQPPSPPQMTHRPDCHPPKHRRHSSKDEDLPHPWIII